MLMPHRATFFAHLITRILHQMTRVDVLAGMVTLARVSAFRQLSVTVFSCGKVVPSFEKAAFDEKTVSGGVSSSTRGGCAECPIGLRSRRIKSRRPPLNTFK